MKIIDAEHQTITACAGKVVNQMFYISIAGHSQQSQLVLEKVVFKPDVLYIHSWALATITACVGKVVFKPDVLYSELAGHLQQSQLVLEKYSLKTRWALATITACVGKVVLKPDVLYP